MDIKSNKRKKQEHNRASVSSSVLKSGFGIFKRSSFVCLKVEIKDEMIKHFFVLILFLKHLEPL